MEDPNVKTESLAVEPSELEREVSRWFGAMLTTVGPMVSTDAYNALMVARDNLNAILHAASAAR